MYKFLLYSPYTLLRVCLETCTELQQRAPPSEGLPIDPPPLKKSIQHSRPSYSRWHDVYSNSPSSNSHYPCNVRAKSVCCKFKLLWVKHSSHMKVVEMTEGGGDTVTEQEMAGAQDTIYLCNFRVSVDGEWLCLKELHDVEFNMQDSLIQPLSSPSPEIPDRPFGRWRDSESALEICFMMRIFLKFGNR